MSILVRNGNGINDIEWVDTVQNGNKVFLNSKTWQIVGSGQTYNCLQRIGNKISDIDYNIIEIQ